MADVRRGRWRSEWEERECEAVGEERSVAGLLGG